MAEVMIKSGEYCETCPLNDGFVWDLDPNDEFYCFYRRHGAMASKESREFDAHEYVYCKRAVVNRELVFGQSREIDQQRFEEFQ